MGGVVNVFTRSADLPPGKRSELTVTSQFGGPDNHRIVSGQLRGQVGRLSSVFSARIARLGDLRGGRETGLQKPTSFEGRAGSGKISYPTSDYGLWTLMYQYTDRRDAPRFDRIDSGTDIEHYYNPQSRNLTYLRLSELNVRSLRMSIDAGLSYHYQAEGRRIIHSSQPDVVQRERDNVHTFGFFAQGLRRYGTRGSITAGIESYYDRIESSRIDTNTADSTVTQKTGSFPDDTRYLTAAFFSSWRSPVVRNLNLHLGARLSVFSIRSDLNPQFGPLEEVYFHPTFECRSMLTVTPGTVVYLGAANAFRAPNASDLTRVGTFNAGIEAPNPDLRPEQALTFEIGMKGRNDPISLDGRLFLSELSDLIVRLEGSYMGADSLDGEPVFIRENSGRARIWGFAIGGKWTLRDDVWLRANTSYTWGQNLRDHEPLRRIPPLSGRSVLGWRTLDDKVEAALMFDWATRQARLSAGDEKDSRIPPGGTPGYGVLGLSATLHPLSGLALSLIFDNILDKSYRVHGSGIDGGGRSFAAELRVRL